MAVPTNNLKELHNISLLHPVALAAGCTLESISNDFNKVDCFLVGCEWDSTPQLNAQLKATSSNYTISKDNQKIKYSLDAATYNKLAGNNFVPTVLVLAILPEDKNERVHELNDEILLKGSLYWFYIQGGKTNNASKITVEIPLKNKLSIEAVRQIMSRLNEYGPQGLSL
jgi:hypothetical protein